MTRNDHLPGDATLPAPSAEKDLVMGGSDRDRKRVIQERVTRGMLAIGFVLLCMLIAGSALRFAVSQLNDPKSLIVEAELQRVARSDQQVRDDQFAADERLRHEARKFDQNLLRDRRDRQWVYESRTLPDEDDAKRVWQNQVDQIEKQLEEARQLQEEVRANEPDREFDLFGEGSVLLDRMKRLEQLKADAPGDWKPDTLPNNAE